MLDTSLSIDLVSFAFSSLRVLTPLLFAALACMMFAKGGNDPIATEGIMLICALAGPVGAYITGNAWLGLAFAMIVGMAVSAVYGYVTLSLRANPVLAGIALNILAGGLTIFIIYYMTGEKGSTQSFANPVLPGIAIPGLEGVPLLGRIFSGHNALTYIALMMTCALHVFIYRTKAGLRLRAPTRWR